MRAIKSKTCSSERNFQDFLNPGIKNNKVIESGTIAANSWAWNNTYKACHINGTSASVKETVEIPLGYFKVGDVITLSAEFMNISGTKGKIALDYTGDVSGNAFIIQTALQNEFEPLEITHVVKNEGTYTALFGIFTGDVGEFYVRNCLAKYESSLLDSTPYKQVIKTFTIKTTDIGVFERDTTVGLDECILTVNPDYIVLTFSKPFNYLSVNPVIFAGEDSASRNYKIRTTGAYQSHVTVQLWNNDNTLPDHTTIPADVKFSIIAIGYDKV